MFTHLKLNDSSMMKGRRRLALLVGICSFSICGIAGAAGDDLVGANIGNLSPTSLAVLCRYLGGVYSPPSAGGTYSCLLPDSSIVCTSDGGCTKTFSPPSGTSIRDQLDVVDIKQSVIISKLDQLAGQVAAIQDYLVDGQSSTPAADFLPVPVPGTPGPQGYCRRDNQGKLLVQVTNQGTVDAGETVTRVEFACGNSQLCSAPTTVDVATSALARLGGTTEEVFDIPAGCFRTDNNQCEFEILTDQGDVVVESDELNNNVSGNCGPLFQ